MKTSCNRMNFEATSEMEVREASGNWFLAGAIHPERGGWYFDSPITFVLEGISGTLHMRQGRFRIALHGSTSFGHEHVLRLARELAQVYADVLGFELGAALTVEVQDMMFVSAAGETVDINFASEWPELSGREPGAVITPEEIGRNVNAALASVQLRLALADLAAARAREVDAAFHCQRALERVRQWVVERHNSTDLNKDSAWKLMRDDLGLDRDELQEISDESTGSRHGEVKHVTRDDQLKWLTVTRNVVRKAIALQNGSPLSEEAVE